MVDGPSLPIRRVVFAIVLLLLFASLPVTLLIGFQAGGSLLALAALFGATARAVLPEYLCLGLLVITLDNTILNVAIPALVKDLHASTSQLQWIIDGYTLVFAGLLLTTGSLGDRFGRRKFLGIGLAIFCVGSGLSALATEPWHLIATRALMRSRPSS